MKTLDQLAIQHGADKGSLWHGYTRVYDTLFAPMRSKPIVLVEIGVQFGASVKMWLDYFPRGSIHGIDILEEFKTDHPRYTFHRADQRNPGALDEVIASLPGSPDIIIDDGCHESSAIEASFRCLWKSLKKGGWYMIEDVFTLWHPHWRSNPRFIKNLMDEINQRGKQFYGRPEGSSEPLTEWEESMDIMLCVKGLVAVSKK